MTDVLYTVTSIKLSINQRICLWALDNFEHAWRTMPTTNTQKIITLPRWYNFACSVQTSFWHGVVSLCLKIPGKRQKA